MASVLGNNDSKKQEESTRSPLLVIITIGELELWILLTLNQSQFH